MNEVNPENDNVEQEDTPNPENNNTEQDNTQYDIHIDVDDGTDAISGATVVIDEVTRTTGDAGGCNFTGLEAGNYLVNVSKEGYSEVVTTISVDADHLTFTVSLTVSDGG